MPPGYNLLKPRATLRPTTRSGSALCSIFLAGSSFAGMGLLHRLMRRVGQPRNGGERMTQATDLDGPSGVMARTTTTPPGYHPPEVRDALSGLARGQPKRIAPRRIGLLGLFGSGNAGNDGSLESMLTFLRRVRPSAELICFCQPSHSAAVRVSRDFQLSAAPLALPTPPSSLLRILDNLSLKIPRRLASLFRAVAHARKLDLLILPGTGSLDDFQKQPLGIPLAIFGWCLAARLCGVRIAFVSVGAGPIRHPLSKWLMKSAAGKANYRSYRDTVSKDFMESIGFDTSYDAVYPDIAFKLPAPPPPFRQCAENRPLIVGLGIMAYKGWRKDSTRGAASYASYLEKIAQFVLWLLDRGHPVRILMGETKDRETVADLVRKAATARPSLPLDRLVIEPICSLHDLMRQIIETDVVVATRFHNIVCALKLGKPTVSIGYGPKNDALMAEMGLERFCQHIESLDVDLLIQQFTQIISDRKSLELSIQDMNRIYKERLERQDVLLRITVTLSTGVSVVRMNGTGEAVIEWRLWLILGC